MPASKKFRAALERGGAPYNWIIVRIPFDAATLWGKRGNLRVNGEVNGVGFNAALFPNGRGGHYMLVNKKLQKETGLAAGDTATFVLTLDEKKKEVPMPTELAAILRKEKSMQRWFASLSQSYQNWINAQVSELKGAEARKRRAEQVAEQILETMEAEIELPPALKIAFSRDPIAYEGWQLMTPTQRRSQLFAIFYYRSVDSRSRRIAKVLANAAEVAEKKKR